jgi:hypothetical protein
METDIFTHIKIIIYEVKVSKNKMNCELMLTYDTPTYMFNVYKNQLSRQTGKVGIWRVQNRFPQYGIPIWSLWPNIRFLPSIVAEKNATKNILDGRTEVKQYTPLRWSGGIMTKQHIFIIKK